LNIELNGSADQLCRGQDPRCFSFLLFRRENPSTLRDSASPRRENPTTARKKVALCRENAALPRISYWRCSTIRALKQENLRTPWNRHQPCRWG